MKSVTIPVYHNEMSNVFQEDLVKRASVVGSGSVMVRFSVIFDESLLKMRVFLQLSLASADLQKEGGGTASCQDHACHGLTPPTVLSINLT